MALQRNLYSVVMFNWHYI